MHACVRHALAQLASFIDQFIASLDERLQFYKLLAGQFSCFGCLSTLSPEELLIAVKTLVDSHPNDLDNSFVSELCHFAKFADMFKDDEPGNISIELFLYELIIDKGVQDTFPNVAIVLVVTNCSAEHSFSKLKQIENRLRTSMTRGRLVNLAIKSTE